MKQASESADHYQQRRRNRHKQEVKNAAVAAEQGVSVREFKETSCVSNLALLTANEAQSRVLNADTDKYDYYIDHRDSSIIVTVGVKQAAESEQEYHQRKRNRHKQEVRDADGAADQGVPLREIKEARNRGRNLRRSSGEFMTSPRKRRARGVESLAGVRQSEKISRAQAQSATYAKRALASRAKFEAGRKSRALMNKKLETLEKQEDEKNAAFSVGNRPTARRRIDSE